MIQEARQSIDTRRKLTQETGRILTLPCLAERFGISPAEVDVLLLAMAPELEPGYEMLYAYLQDDATRKRLSVDLTLNLICRSERARLHARRFFAPESALIYFRIIELYDEAQDRQPTLLRKFLRVEDSLQRFLLEQPPASLQLGSFVSPAVSIDALEVDSGTKLKLRNLVASVVRTGTAGTIIRVEGREQAELAAAAEALGDELQKPLLLASLAELQKCPASVPVLVRDAKLLGAVVAILGAEPTPTVHDAKPETPPFAEMWRALADLSGPILALGPPDAFTGFPREFAQWNIGLPQPDFELRKRCWESALNGTVENADYSYLAETFRFGTARIRQATALARSFAALREPSNPVPSFADVVAAGRSLGSPNLQRFAVPIEPRYGWNDIVLSDDRREQLEQIAARVEFRGTVHRNWGFGEKLSRGKGLNILFTGPSGVGKTMAAEVLANALSLTLFQIDLSSVVSKYIGETEAHLSAIFGEAESAQCLLFFDEADSLFGKRTEVKDAHDRYANLEVNYLLQRIEQYDGVVVLATNLQRNLDDAFLRRMHEVVDFPFPDERQREQIWRRHLPTSAPVDPDIDFAFLARQFKLTGGYIKNAVMTAAFLAARNAKNIGMEEMIRGVKIELQKQGKLVMKSDFGRFFETVQRARIQEPV
jgi:hypothetical protein